MAPGRLFQIIDVALRLGAADVLDPGASGTVVINNKGFAILLAKTEGPETRVLEDADNLAVGQELLVVLYEDGGDLTIDSDDADVVLTAVGDVARFVVSFDGTNKVWKCVYSSTAKPQNVVTRATAAAAANLIPVSNGADKALKAATPAALGTVAITTGNSATNVALIALAQALAGFGLVTHTWTDGDA